MAFLIPLIIYFLFFLWKGCFTDKTILSSDMHDQYMPLFQYLRNVLHGDASFPYSFSKGLGGGMYGTLFYYFANPFNLLVYFFEDIPLFLNVLVILKLALSGLTCYTFLKYKFKDEKYLLIFALAYAFMSYNINYYVNVMWLDGVILAPIVLLGIERILEKKGDWLYLLTLFFTIFFNYYIGYIVVVFSFIYYAYIYFLKYGKDWKKEFRQLLHFCIITILIGLTTSFILVPSGLELLGVTRATLAGGDKWINLNFLDFIAPTYIGFGNLINPLNYFGFCIFIGTAMIPLLICYFCNKKIEKREKISTLIVYTLFLLPIVIPFFNRFWHMFTIPIAFNYRYSFLTILFTIIILIRTLKVLEIPKKSLLIYYVIFIILSCSLAYTSFVVPEYYVFINIYKIIVTVLLVGINIYLLFKNKIKIMLILLFLELVSNLVWIGYDSKLYLDKEYRDNKEKIIEFSSYCNNNKRCETKLDYVFNDSILGNYNGISLFLSTMNGNVTSFLSSASNYSDDRNYFIYRTDMVLDMLLGIEIVELREPILDYELLKTSEINDQTFYLYKNPNALSLGYLVSPKIKNFNSKEEGFLFLQELLNVMDNNKREYFIELPIEKISDKEYMLKKDKKYPYLYLYGNEVTKINGEKLTKILLSANDYGVIYDEYGDTLTFSFDEVADYFKVYVLDVSKLKEFRKNKVELVIDGNLGNKIESHIEVPTSSTLFTTIPYEKGWKVKVDGKERESYKVIDTFLALDLEPGYHTITFEYHVYGLKLGILMSVISVLLLVGYEYRENKKKVLLISTFFLIFRFK